MMRCPRCVQGIHRGAEACPHCGYRLEDLMEAFADRRGEIRQLEDAAGLMRQSERQQVARALDRFDHKFPDLFFAIHTTRLDRADQIHPFGLWLLNCAKITDLHDDQKRDGGVLLTLDPDHKLAAMAWGYRLDPILTEHDTFLALSRAHAYWMEGQFAAGIRRVIEQITLALIKRARQVKRHPERYGIPKSTPRRRPRHP